MSDGAELMSQQREECMIIPKTPRESRMKDYVYSVDYLWIQIILIYVQVQLDWSLIQKHRSQRQYFKDSVHQLQYA